MKKSLDSIDVKTPCYESWKQMSGGGNVRFCSHCEKDVYNLSAMTRSEAEKLIKNSPSKICVRYAKTARGKVITTPPKLTQITRRGAIAAGVLAVTLSLSAASYSQEAFELPNNHESAESEARMPHSDSKQSKKKIEKPRKTKKKIIGKKSKVSSNKKHILMGILQ